MPRLRKTMFEPTNTGKESSNLHRHLIAKRVTGARECMQCQYSCFVRNRVGNGGKSKA